MSFKFPLVLVVAALSLSACKPVEPPAPPAPPAAPAAPAAAPAPVAPAAKPEKPSLKLETFDGKTFDLAEHRGRWVVVNFWATWCTPCLKEIPDLDAFDKTRADVDIIGLAYEEIERADMEAFLKEHPMSYPMAIIDTYNPPADFDTPRGLPMTYLIAPDGKVAKQFLGPTTSEELAKMIEKAAQTTATP
ncbi:TlpA family protein disulfide reductase [Arenimonas sp.]|uniref:TlpA family protein disulfide reductase n=1 Tax=Arenimonas sp. TaxID=1872635 RepID=UPI0039E274A1